MSKGYICVVQNSGGANYVRMAYALALSIRNTQSSVNNLSIVTDSNIPSNMEHVFDRIIPLKNDRTQNEIWKLHNIVDLYDYSPYKETVLLDADMLFLTDVSHWWQKLQERNIWFTTNPRNYRGLPLPKETMYRQEFIHNNLPSVYQAFFYFKKSEDAAKLFDQTKLICEHWDNFVDEFMAKKKPKIFSTDVAFALAIKTLGISQKTTMPFLSFPYFTHMKTYCQNWILKNYESTENWTDYVPLSFDCFNNSLGIKIATIRQKGILHYYIKDFITDEMIEILESQHG